MMKKILLLCLVAFFAFRCEEDKKNPDQDIKNQEWFKKLQTTCEPIGICKTSIMKADYNGQPVYYTTVYGALCDPAFNVHLYNSKGDIIKKYGFDDAKKFQDEVKGSEIVYQCEPFFVMDRGNIYGAGKENIAKQNLVIKSEKQWKELKDKMNSVNHETTLLDKFDINFNYFNIIAVFSEVQSTGGYAIEVTDATETATKLSFKIIKIAPAQDVATTVMTQSYFIARINKTDKEIAFVE